MRKLAIGALSFSAAIFAANYILPRSWLPLFALLLALIGFGLLFFKRRWLLAFEIAFISAAFGLALFYAHSLFTAVPAAGLSGREMEIEAVLLDYPIVYEDYCSVYVRLTGEHTPRLKAILYDNERQLLNAQPGQHIRLTASLKAADTRYGEEYDYYFSKNIYLIANSRSEIELLFSDSPWRSLPVRIRHGVTNLIDELFPADTAAFMRSLMLGDKSRLYDDIQLHTALSRAGFMHIAAVSGMHLAFLVGLIQLLLGRTRYSSVLCIALVWLFVLMTGAPPSAVRAGFMLSALLMAPILRRENDKLTSLSSILALVLLFNPYAAASVSLQLSFAAMAGLLCFASRIDRVLTSFTGRDELPALPGYFVGIVSASLSVMVFTTPLLAIHFGYVALLSPISNMLVLWAVSFCFCGGFICCIVGALIPAIGAAGAWLVSWFARYIFLIATLVSKISFATVYLANPFMWGWLFLSITAVVAALIIKMPVGVKLAYPLILCFVLLAQANMLARWYYSSGMGTMAVLDVGQGQSLAFVSDGGAVLVDCGSTGTLENAGEIAGAYLLSRGVRSIDALVLTHLHRDHANGALAFMELVDVDNIYMPIDPQDDEGYLPLILESARRHDSTIHYVSDDLRIVLGNIGLRLYKPGQKGDANERCIMCRISLGDYDMLVTADSDMSAENALVEAHDLSGVDAFVVGHHGSRYSSSQALMSELGADIAVISVGYNTYGHPSYETLERLGAYGFDIYRTDLNGTVEIRPRRQD